MKEGSTSVTEKGTTKGRLPGLDGLRGLAAVGVALLHAALAPDFPNVGPLKRFLLGWGHECVPLFFVLSGFLITHLLLREEERHGRISLKSFYARRALRILPAAFTYLLILAVLTPVLGLTVRWIEIIASAFWFRNFLYDGWAAWAHHVKAGIHFTGHFWSLSVEEHFYVVWPLMLVFMPRKRRLPFLLTAIVLVAFWRMLNLHWAGVGGMNYWRTDLVCDYLLAGAALAVAGQQYGGHSAWRGIWTSPWLFATGMACLIWHAAGEYYFDQGPVWRVMEATRVSVLAFGLVCVVGHVVQGGSGPLHRFLGCAPLRWLGAISFSLYLWQEPFTSQQLSRAVDGFPQNMVFALLAAMASYYWVEQPFLRLRHRFER